MRTRTSLFRVSALAIGLGAAQAMSPGVAAGQTLIEALSAAYNSNPDLLAARATLRQTDETLTQALSNWRPRISVGAEYNKITLESISTIARPTDFALNGRTLSVTATQPLFRGGQTVADTKAAQANIQSQRALLADSEQIVLLAVATAYADLLRDATILGIRQNNVRVLTQQLDATQARFRVGELTITDVAQSEARLAGARAELVTAEAALRISVAAYQRQVGKTPGRMADLPLLGTLPGTEEETISLAMEAAPRAISAQHRITAANQGVNSAVGTLLPTINLVAFGQQINEQTRPNDQFTSYGMRLQATAPIYQNGTEWSRVRVAKELVGQRRNELDSARRLAAENVVRAWRNLEAAKSRVTSFEAQVRASDVALNGVRQEQLVGSRTTLDVLNAEQELLNAQVQLTTARRDMAVNHYGVLSGVGRLTARALTLPVEYYDEDKYYNEVGWRWFGAGE